MKHRIALLSLAACGGLTVPAAAANAATIKVPRCVPIFKGVKVYHAPIRGSGFTPDAGDYVSAANPLKISLGPAYLKADGTLRTYFVPKYVPNKFRAKRLKIKIIDAKHPSITATAKTHVINQTDNSNAAHATSGKPHAHTRWKFGGWAPHHAIYGHFRYHGHTVRNYRFGKAKGACGTLTTKALRMPVRHVREGTWKLQIDQRRHFKRHVKHKARYKITVFRY